MLSDIHRAVSVGHLRAALPNGRQRVPDRLAGIGMWSNTRFTLSLEQHWRCWVKYPCIGYLGNCAIFAVVDRRCHLYSLNFPAYVPSRPHQSTDRYPGQSKELNWVMSYQIAAALLPMTNAAVRLPHPPDRSPMSVTTRGRLRNQALEPGLARGSGRANENHHDRTSRRRHCQHASQRSPVRD
ncbi:hypothetical protein SDC9_188890 [bioreactor metagenome]|uniref:Uncharacterized protein n=1 Tax=bioreactor metagenome TaxID=1076179 RepID=A0A645HQK6_9ZZZZ